MIKIMKISLIVLTSQLLLGCSAPQERHLQADHQVAHHTIDRTQYTEQLYGFWLGTSIANWTGLVTEMDKIGSIGEIQTGTFYTRADWGQADHPNIWSEGKASDISPTIDFVFMDEDSIWGADDDTDIEYIYQELLLQHESSILTGDQIRQGWLKHIRTEEENYLSTYG